MTGVLALGRKRIHRGLHATHHHLLHLEPRVRQIVHGVSAMIVLLLVQAQWRQHLRDDLRRQRERAWAAAPSTAQNGKPKITGNAL